jgi:hypothetical protein
MRRPSDIPGAIAPSASGLWSPTEYARPITGQIHMAGNGPIIRDCFARDIAGPVIYGGLPNRPWDRLDESCIRNGVIERVLFVNCGNSGADEGIIWIPRQLTGWLTIRDCAFIGCHGVCIYFDDLASGLFAPIIIVRCLFVDCEQAMLIGGGRGFTIYHITEYNSRKPSVIDDRAQVPRTSPRSCRWEDPPTPNGPYVTPWEQARLEFEQMGVSLDVPTLAREFHTGGTIRNWTCANCDPPTFLDGADKHWDIRL